MQSHASWRAEQAYQRQRNGTRGQKLAGGVDPVDVIELRAIWAKAFSGSGTKVRSVEVTARTSLQCVGGGTVNLGGLGVGAMSTAASNRRRCATDGHRRQHGARCH